MNDLVHKPFHIASTLSLNGFLEIEFLVQRVNESAILENTAKFPPNSDTILNSHKE